MDRGLDVRQADPEDPVLDEATVTFRQECRHFERVKSVQDVMADRTLDALILEREAEAEVMEEVRVAGQIDPDPAVRMLTPAPKIYF